MSIQRRKLLWPAMIAVAAIFSTLLWLSVRTKVDAHEDSPAAGSALNLPGPQRHTASRLELRAGLVHQPEALKQSRVLGRRFSGRKPGASNLVGVLTIGNDEQRIRLVRRQASDGETIEAVLSRRPATLSWSAVEGLKSPGNSLSNKERFIIERLILDSPEQFVMAQFRGASYYTIGHHVRPTEVGDADNYTGPTWNVVRVVERAGASARRTDKRQWRLYYINTTTGLIERIVSPETDGTIVAELSDWTEIDNEKVASRITWSRQGQVVMQFILTNFSQAAEQ